MKKLTIRIAVALLALVALAWLGVQAWRLWMPNSVERRIVAAAQPGDIYLYSYTTCGICKRAKIWMELNSIPYESCFPDSDRECNTRFHALKTPGTPTWVIRGQTLLGWDREAMALALEAPRR